MADIVNLRMARKRKARAEEATKAEQNRVLHGRSGSDKRLETQRKARETALLDGHKLPPRDENER